MKYIIFSFLFSFIIISSGAQTIVPLIGTKKLHNIHQLPFDKAYILDNRFDSTQIAFSRTGIYLYRMQNPDSSFSLIIKKYIDTAIAKFLKENGILYISIKQLREENLNPSIIFFSADAYFQTDGIFKKIATIKKDYIIRGANGEKSCAKITMRAFNDLIEKVDYNYYHRQNIDSAAYTFNDINSNVTTDWMNYPIMKENSSSSDGIYRSFEDLRNNTIEPANISVEIEPDSTYSLSFSNKDYKKWKGYYNIYAISYNGRRYIKVGDKYFLPILKVNNKLCFYVPLSLPNMSAIIALKSLTYATDPGNTSSATSIGGLAVGLAINAATQSHRDKVYNETKQNITNQGLSSNEKRNCYIDMDTGDLIY